MHRRHVSFFLDQAYGNTIPSFGIAMELKRRGHKVTYVVTASFAPLIRSINAIPIVLDFIETRAEGIAAILKENDHLGFRIPYDDVVRLKKEMCDRRTRHALSQLDKLCGEGVPDLVVHDDSMDTIGRAFALQMGLVKIRLATQFIRDACIACYANDELVLVTVPRFFQRNLGQFEADPRFKFVGFMPEGRSLPFRAWTALSGTYPRVLVSPTSGLNQQVEFCRKIIEIFRDQPWDVILSISATQDDVSAFDPRALNDVPRNIHVNRHSGNFDIMPNVDLFVGQAGQGGTLEAIYWGLPQILLPPTPDHYLVAHRVVELSLGICLPIAELSRQTLIEHATKLLNDKDVLTKVREAQRWIRDPSGAARAADIIEDRLA